MLTWEERVKILRYCAVGLRYLHNHIDGCIVHRDVKVNLSFVKATDCSYSLNFWKRLNAGPPSHMISNLTVALSFDLFIFIWLKICLI